MNKKQKEIIFGILFLGVLVLLGLNASLYSVRIDATENKMFSIHPVSQNLFRDIPERVRLTYFLSEKLKTVSADYGQIEDILRAYASHSNGKIVLAVVDPSRDNRQQEAQDYGVQQFDAGRRDAADEASIFVAYSGIVIEYLDRHRTLARVDEVDTLEYDLSSIIRSLVTDRTRKIGYLIDDQMIDPREFAGVARYLQQDYEVSEITRGNDIPAALDALVVIGGLSLTEGELFPIDQYVMRGGRVFIATAAVAVNLQYLQAMPSPTSPLLALLKSYGVTIQPELIMEEPRRSVQLDYGRSYNYWFSTTQDLASRDNPITARFQPVRFCWASPLELAVAPPVEAETLIATSPHSVAVKDDFRLNPAEASLMYRVFAGEGGKSRTVAAALTGSFTSYFKGKAAPAGEGAPPNRTTVEASSAPARIIVVGNSFFLNPNREMRFLDMNGFYFFANSLTWLANDDDLLAIRTRAQRDSSMVKITDPAARDAWTTAIKIVNWVGVPLIIIAIGLANYFLRRKKRTE